MAGGLFEAHSARSSIATCHPTTGYPYPVFSSVRRIKPNPALDLFGQVAVNWSEVSDWLESVPRIPRKSWRAGHYIRYWNVPEKIAAAKLQGTFEQIISRAGSDNPSPLVGD